MTDRSIDLFTVERSDAKYGTTHVHAYIRAGSDRTYSVFVCPFSYPVAGESIRSYPLSAGGAFRVERFDRYSGKRLAALAADPTIVAQAKALAGI